MIVKIVQNLRKKDSTLLATYGFYECDTASVSRIKMGDDYSAELTFKLYQGEVLSGSGLVSNGNIYFMDDKGQTFDKFTISPERK